MARLASLPLIADSGATAEGITAEGIPEGIELAAGGITGETRGKSFLAGVIGFGQSAPAGQKENKAAKLDAAAKKMAFPRPFAGGSRRYNNTLMSLLLQR
jgi:hypothetical protein